MTSSASFEARPGRASVADALAHILLDPSGCPSCGAALSGARCARCGIDLTGSAGGRVWTLGQQAVLALRERERLVAGLRVDAARAGAHAVVPGRPAEVPGRRSAAAAPPFPPRLPGPPAFPSAPAPAPAPARGLAVQSLLVGLGALLLAVAAVVFLAVAWDLLGLAGRAAVVGALTAAALGAAAVLRPRLPDTAEALGALGAVLVVGDAWAARATGLGDADAVPGLLYAAVVAAAAAVLLGGIGAVAGLRSGTVTAAVLAPAAPVLAGLHLADGSSVLPIVAGLLAGALVAAARGLLPGALQVEARVAAVAAVTCTASAALLLVWLPPSAAVTAAALAGVAVLAVQAIADGSRRRGGGAHASAAGTAGGAWSGAAGGAVVLTAVLGALTLLTGPDAPPVVDVLVATDRSGGASGGSWVGPATAVIAAALAAAALLLVARRLPGTLLGRRLSVLVRAGLRFPDLAAGAAVALAITALPVVAGAVGVLAALVRASSVPWRAGPGAPIGTLPLGPWAASTTQQFVLAAGLVVPGLLLIGAAAGGLAERTEKVTVFARRGGTAAVVAGLVVLCTLPELRVVTGVALLSAAAVAAAALAERTRSAAFAVASAGFAAPAALLAWTSQVMSGPVTALGVLGLLAARRAFTRPEIRAGLTGAAVLAGGLAVTAVAAPLLSATAAWSALPPVAVARLAAVLAVACVLAGVAALALPAARVPDLLPAERAAAAATAAVVGVLALVAPMTAGLFTETAVVFGALLALASTAAVAPDAVGVTDVRVAAAGFVPVLAASLAATAATAAGGGVPAAARAAVLAAVAVAAGLVALALRVPTWPADQRRVPAEVGAGVAAAAGLVLGGALPGGWMLFALVGAGLGALAVTPERSRLADASIAPLAVASGLLLAQAGVSMPEAYTLPPALALLALGGYRLRTGREVGSWPALGPGLVLALAPSVVAAADGGPLVRVVVLALAAGATVLAGVRLQLAAPVAVGAAALGVHAVVQLGPWLAELGTSVPRWTVLAVVGALLLLVGATYERQVTRLRAAAVRLASLR